MYNLSLGGGAGGKIPEWNPLSSYFPFICWGKLCSRCMRRVLLLNSEGENVLCHLEGNCPLPSAGIRHREAVCSPWEPPLHLLTLSSSPAFIRKMQLPWRAVQHGSVPCVGRQCSSSQ